MITVGKREFTLGTSKYLKQAQEMGEEIVITHQKKPVLKLVPLNQKTIKDLRGLITQIEEVEAVTEPVFPPYDQWFS